MHPETKRLIDESNAAKAVYQDLASNRSGSEEREHRTSKAFIKWQLLRVVALESLAGDFGLR